MSVDSRKWTMSDLSWKVILQHALVRGAPEPEDGVTFTVDEGDCKRPPTGMFVYHGWPWVFAIEEEK